MKNTKLNVSLFLLFFGIFINCQTEIIWGQETPNLPQDFLSSGNYYYKDVQNNLYPFIGTWEYVNGNKEFQVILTKVVKYHTVVSDLNFNFYEDGITIQYKKFENGNLIFQSPIIDNPTFSTVDGVTLEGAMTDYGRTTIEVQRPTFGFLEPYIIHNGGEFFYPRCKIEKVFLPPNLPSKITFKLYIRSGSTGGFGSPYNNPAYQGQPFFSVPNNIILTKVP